MIEFKTRIYFYYTAAWHLCEDVLSEPAPAWEYGLPGSGIMDLVADSGILQFALDNSPSNSAGLSGYYSPGHTNAATWFVDNLKVKVVCERQDTMASSTRFIGVITDIIPASGVFGEATVDVMAVDWMDSAHVQKLGSLAIQTGAGLGVDDVLTAALATFAIQPEATDFDEGVEVFASIFDTDDANRMTMATLFQKYARNEGGGHIYLKGNGTLTFDHRHIRPMSATNSFTLDATVDTPMAELQVEWARKDIINRVEVKVYPAQVDTGSTTVIWRLRDGFAMSAGQVMVLTCPFVDPDTGDRISASDVVTPLISDTHIKFGSNDDGTSNDLIANLTYPMVVGGNTATITLTAAVAGWVNKIEILGNGIYRYEPMILANEDAASVALRGLRPLSIVMEQVSSASTAQLMANYFTGLLKDPAMRVHEVRFLANFSSAFATAALTVEPNVRFAIKETQTGADLPLFACRIRYEAVGPLLWVTIVPVSVAGGGELNYFIWDLAGHGWDEGVWVF